MLGGARDVYIPVLTQKVLRQHHPLCQASSKPLYRQDTIYLPCSLIISTQLTTEIRIHPRQTGEWKAMYLWTWETFPGPFSFSQGERNEDLSANEIRY